MKKRSPSLFLSRLFCLLMALYVLNFSVDPPDGHVRVTVYGEEKEDLRVNEMESIGEWILEHILGIKNAVPEHDASEEWGKVTKSVFYWVTSNTPISFLLPPVSDSMHPATYSFCPPVFISHYSEVTSPHPGSVQLSSCLAKYVRLGSSYKGFTAFYMPDNLHNPFITAPLV